jgi:hypothetical protein
MGLSKQTPQILRAATYVKHPPQEKVEYEQDFNTL